MKSVDPATEAVLETFAEHDAAEVERALERADAAFAAWSSRPVEDREALLARVADVLETNAGEYAETITAEMGKPIAQAEAEVAKCAQVCRHYAERAGEYLQDERLGADPGAKTYVRYEPLGTILAIMPWNYPFWQVFRFAAPHLTAGNVGLLKHAPNVQGCAAAIESIFREAGYPEGAFSSLRISPAATEELIADGRIDGVTLTGSTRAGRAVGRAAGGALTKSVLELGGSDPFVVCADAPLEETVSCGVTARTQNAGQTCIAAKRFIVHEDVAAAFTDRLVERLSGLTVGDPRDRGTDVGPLARGDLLETLHEQVTASVEAGATLECGGDPLERPGNFYAPTVLTDVPAAAPATTEELFGPVAAIFTVDSEDAAIRLANDTAYGLGASVWTADRERGERIARELDVGAAFVNRIVQSDPRLPFGGTNDSGYGSELSSHGIREFTTPKTVWVE